MSPLLAVDVLTTHSWKELERQLRSVALMGDATVRPYEHAKISSRTITAEDIRPIARYVLQSQLDVQQKLRELLLNEGNIDIFNLRQEAAQVRFSVKGESGEWSLMPPVVEVSDVDGGVPILVDGEHRFMLAHQLGLPVEVIWIEGIPRQFPVVATPVTWNDVKVHARVPELFHKRNYRFPKLTDFPDVSKFSKVNITEKNYLYYFYRDLGKLCSSGVRASGGV